MNCSKFSKTRSLKVSSYRTHVMALGAIILASVVLTHYLPKTNATESDSVRPRGIPEENLSRFSSGKIKVTNSEKDCLKEALWYEARGTSKKEQEMIADVIINRAKANSSSICKEISKRSQFSYRNKGKVTSPVASNRIDEKSLDLIHDVVQNKIQVIKGEVLYKSSLPLEVQYYARKDIKNYWTRTKKQIKIASGLKHNFYY